jgi:hypothetical protein
VGFHEALRYELMHWGSNVHTTMVYCPGCTPRSTKGRCPGCPAVPAWASQGLLIDVTAVLEEHY